LRGLHIQKLKYLPAVLTVVGLLFSTACGTPAQFGLNEQTESFGQVVTYNTQVDMLLVVGNKTNPTLTTAFTIHRLLGYKWF